MIDTSEKERALSVLKDDAENIIQLVGKQQNSLCLTQCPAFEEVVDTQMFGYSKEVAFVVRMGYLTPKAGQQMVSELEKRLNQIYADSFEKSKEQ